MFNSVPTMDADKQARREGWLRRTARKHGLVATKVRGTGLWRFSNADGALMAEVPGLTLDEAEAFMSRTTPETFQVDGEDITVHRMV